VNEADTSAAAKRNAVSASPHLSTAATQHVFQLASYTPGSRLFHLVDISGFLLQLAYHLSTIAGRTRYLSYHLTCPILLAPQRSRPALDSTLTSHRLHIPHQVTMESPYVPGDTLQMALHTHTDDGPEVLVGAQVLRRLGPPTMSVVVSVAVPGSEINSSRTWAIAVLKIYARCFAQGLRKEDQAGDCTAEKERIFTTCMADKKRANGLVRGLLEWSEK
jgi:hypothetical protein